MTDNTLLLRQVNPNFIVEGRITSQVFTPTPKDHKKLSVYDGDQINPEVSWKHFSENYKSSGVLAVSVIECLKLDLPVQPDPKPFPEHVVINFSAFGDNQIRKKAKQLKTKAETRGWLYRAE